MKYMSKRPKRIRLGNKLFEFKKEVTIEEKEKIQKNNLLTSHYYFVRKKNYHSGGEFEMYLLRKDMSLHHRKF